MLFDVRAGRPLSTIRPDKIPSGFQAVAEMLLDGRVEPETLRDAGRAAADNGTSLEAALDDLVTTCELTVDVAEPAFWLVKAVAAGWSDAQMGYLHSVSCEDPLTGLATLHHVRTTLGDTFRAAERDAADPQVALVVVDLVDRGLGIAPLDRTLRLVHIAEIMRTVYSGDETLGQLSSSRAVAVVRRDANLATTVRGLRELLTGWVAAGGPSTRVWIEGMPSTFDAAVALLDELAR